MKTADSSIKLSRRALMSLGAGGTLLAPFLRTLHAEEKGQRRKRFLLVLQSNGMAWSRMMPPELRMASSYPKYAKPWDEATSQETVNSTDWQQMPSMITNLARHKSQMLIFDGLANRQNGNGGNHHNGTSAVTCLPNKGSTEGGGPMGASFDQYLAASPAMSQAAFGSVDLLVGPSGANQSLLATGPERPLPLLRSPREALLRYFGGPAADQAAVLSRKKRKRLFDVMRGDITRVNRELPAADRVKLDGYLDSVGQLEARLLRTEVLTCKKEGPVLPANLSTNNPSTSTEIEDITTSMFSIASEALACGVSQVATVSIATGSDHYGPWRRVLGDTGQGKSVHQLAHNDAPGAGVLDAIWNFVAGQIATSIDRLQAAQEGGRSVWDDTTILWISPNGSYHHHPGQFRWNGVVLGNAGGKLRSDGRYLKYPTARLKGNQFTQLDMVGSDQPNIHSMGDLYCTLAHALGAPTDSFGKQGQEPVKGPLPEVLL